MSDNSASEDQDPSPVDAGAIAEADAGELAVLASQASDEQLAEAMSDPENRKRVLDEIFGRMADHTDPAQIKDVDAVVQFKITGAPDGGGGPACDSAIGSPAEAACAPFGAPPSSRLSSSGTVERCSALALEIEPLRTSWARWESIVCIPWAPEVCSAE